MRKILYFILLLLTLSINSQTKKETQLYILNKLKMYVDQSDDYIISFSMDQSGFWFEYKPETKNLNTRKYSFPLWSIDKISLHSRNLTFYLNNYCSTCLVQITGNQNQQIKSFTLGLKSAYPEEDFLGRFQRAIDHLKTMYPKKPVSSDLFDKDRGSKIEESKDLNKLITEGERQYEAGNLNESRKLFTKALELNPNNFIVLFNLGIIAYYLKDSNLAKSYYLKALRINPNHLNSNINLVNLILDEQETLYKQFSSIKYSEATKQQYNQSKQKWESVLRTSIPYLKKLVQLDKNNKAYFDTLKSVYESLGMTRELIELKN